jgi:tRNA A37 threonylcarbamoyladenosine biosynthesis protein TsaE
VQTIAHVDLYRVSSLSEEDPDLLADYIGTDTIAFVEWPDGAEQELSALAPIAYRVKLSHRGDDRRAVEIR